MDGQDEGFVESIGESIGEALAWIGNSSFGEMGRAVRSFFDGLARGAGLEDASFLAWVFAVIAVLLLVSGVRSLLGARILGGIVKLLIGIVLLGWALG